MRRSVVLPNLRATMLTTNDVVSGQRIVQSSWQPADPADMLFGENLLMDALVLPAATRHPTGRYTADDLSERNEDMSYRPDVPPPPDRAPRSRPSVVTAAAVLMLIGGGLSILAGIILLSGAGVAAGQSVGGLFVFVGVILLVVGGLEVYAGIKVLDLRESGRVLGITLAGVAAVLNLLSLGRTPGSSVTGLAINAFILCALITNAQYFSP